MFNNILVTGFDTEKELEEAYLQNSGVINDDDNFIDLLFVSSPVFVGVIFENNFTEGIIPNDFTVGEYIFKDALYLLPSLFSSLVLENINNIYKQVFSFTV